MLRTTININLFLFVSYSLIFNFAEMFAHFNVDPIGVLPAVDGAGDLLEPAHRPDAVDGAAAPLHPQPLLHPPPPTRHHVLAHGQRSHHLALPAQAPGSTQVGRLSNAITDMGLFYIEPIK